MVESLKTIIDLQNVTYARKPGAPLLSNINLNIPAGQWVSIVGPNGVGKSTLIKLINGLLTKQEGKIIVDGIELTDQTVGDIRSRVGMIFSNPDNQFVGMTVEEDIAFGLENRCLDRQSMRQRVCRVSDKLQITHLLDRHPNQLSGGQKQRVAIAGVLAIEPKILIFDEATSMLDERSKQEINELIKELMTSGQYTVVSVTHDTEEMLASDRIIALNDEGIAADGAPNDIFRNEELLRRCKIKPPFLLQLSRALQNHGITLQDCANEDTFMEALWEFNLRT